MATAELPVDLVLYVDAGSVASRSAEAMVHGLAARLPGSGITLRVVNALSAPEEATRDGASVLPTLIVRRGSHRLLTLSGPLPPEDQLRHRLRRAGVDLAAAASPRAFVRRLSGVRLLVIEDEADARDALALLLQAHGAVVHAVASGEEALALLADAAPDVIVSDVALPGLDGAQTLARVRLLDDARLRDVPAVALTAHDGPEERIRLHATGFAHCLGKPVEPQGLVDALVALATAPPFSQ